MIRLVRGQTFSMSGGGRGQGNALTSGQDDVVAKTETETKRVIERGQTIAQQPAAPCWSYDGAGGGPSQTSCAISNRSLRAHHFYGGVSSPPLPTLPPPPFSSLATHSTIGNV